ncbi:MAG: hypothetical protein ACE5RE_05345 [Candidatus Nitrosomaritimum aestuariumsis]
MSIQILQYEFLGPIKLDEWGPPMEKVVYLILSRTKDSFNIIYVGDCEKTDEKNFFITNANFKCWVQKAGSENSLYLAILPMFNSPSSARIGIINKILQRYKPSCNENNVAEKKPDYVVRPKIEGPEPEEPEQKVSCPCCGSQMNIDKVLENTTVLKCTGCGLSDTRVNS